MRFSPGQVSSARGHDNLGGSVREKSHVGDEDGPGLGVGFFVGRRVGLFVGRRVGLGVWTPLTIENDTRYVVSIFPFTLAVTVCAPALRIDCTIFRRKGYREQSSLCDTLWVNSK
jgi:hypothetical protein